ncbi:aminoacyl-tRNA hydrolase [Spiribacter vilamensis]|uniref:Peptidyl-tRNA hydrolase n=1 Tax=Spiribacter vilamensis TaxID=531306 RepID=A0A4Q8CY27_9GAMM|nr:aminoacyl-tRNA hydrolase [Spiribacter vilamensis]RZU97863.1 peptidyl-tRNA hydrolase [Spiribacter vilamensis]TVO61218.1 aminoacyl-tRNA hydrolase [Spiribacter vilamensis]
MTATPIRLIAGLGNPGPKYAGTRHNAGFWLVERVADRLGVDLRSERKFHGATGRYRADGADLHLLCPDTFMNHSGRAVAALARFHRIDPEAVLIVHDEIDLPAGVVRLKRGGGHGGHNGLRDIVGALGSREFARLRVGVGHPGNSDQVIPYVLHAPSRDERLAIDSAVDAGAAQVPELAIGHWDTAQQQLHTRG